MKFELLGILAAQGTRPEKAVFLLKKEETENEVAFTHHLKKFESPLLKNNYELIKTATSVVLLVSPQLCEYKANPKPADFCKVMLAVATKDINVQLVITNLKQKLEAGKNNLHIYANIEVLKYELSKLEAKAQPVAKKTQVVARPTPTSKPPFTIRKVEPLKKDQNKNDSDSIASNSVRIISPVTSTISNTSSSSRTVVVPISQNTSNTLQILTELTSHFSEVKRAESVLVELSPQAADTVNTPLNTHQQALTPQEETAKQLRNARLRAAQEHQESVRADQASIARALTKHTHDLKMMNKGAYSWDALHRLRDPQREFIELSNKDIDQKIEKENDDRLRSRNYRRLPKS
ncbi:MAG: hypothetical protein ABI597_07960 [Gammaproteobacteria bacterium]